MWSTALAWVVPIYSIANEPIKIVQWKSGRWHPDAGHAGAQWIGRLHAVAAEERGQVSIVLPRNTRSMSLVVPTKQAERSGHTNPVTFCQKIARKILVSSVQESGGGQRRAR